MKGSIFFYLSLVIVLSWPGCKEKETTKDLLLWYDKPATDWYEALPIGNGTLGGMVYGGISHEVIQLNENTLYSGEPGQRHVEIDVTKSLDQVRALIDAGKLVEVEKIIASEWLGRAQDCYQPLGHLYIDFEHDEHITEYRRQLDLSTAISRVDYQIGDVSYQREVFASHPDHVLVLMVEADRQGSISCRIRLEGAHPTASTTMSGNTLVMKGQAPALALRRPVDKIREWNQEWMYPELFDQEGNIIPGRSNIMYGDILDGRGTFYEGRVGVQIEGGSVTVDGGQLLVQDADKMKIVFSGDTSFSGFDRSPSREGVDPSIRAKSAVSNALQKSYRVLREDHIRDYQSLFNRVKFRLGEISEQSSWPTTSRLEAFQNGMDPSFTALFLQYARYLTIASSREGGQPINLQGMWNKDIIPPWAGAYTMNINTEIYYWMTEAANLSECTEPILRFTRELSVDGTRHVQEAFGLEGWTAHHNTAIWRGAEPVDYYNCSFWPFAGAWLCQQIITHYEYTRDKAFLEDYWPVLKGAARFLSGWLVETEEGYFTTPVGSSPENRFYSGDSDQTTAFCQGPTMDIMLTRELFANCLSAATVLGDEDEFMDIIKHQHDHLVPYKIGSQGQLLEWDKEYKELDPQHRHISHIYGLCPGNDITKDKTPALFDAVKRTLELRGDGGTGWSMAWKACAWARLKEGDRAYDNLKDLFTPGGYTEPGLIPNLLASCPPFNIDGNFGAGAAILDMLLQSHETKTVGGVEMPIIELLPALPNAWSAGEITGLRARNGFEVDMVWEGGELVSAKIRSLLGEDAVLKYSGVELDLDLRKGESYMLRM